MAKGGKGSKGGGKGGLKPGSQGGNSTKGGKGC